jgi:hypothetical protein
MSDESQIIDDPRGLIFTIERRREPVYQVESKHWASEEHRWHKDDIPSEIHAKVEELKASGKPGAFARFTRGDAGVYVIYEGNIKRFPEAADGEIVFDPARREGSEKELSAGDLVICARGGMIYADSGDVFHTEQDSYYVVKSETWGRFVSNQETRPWPVAATKDSLILLETLHGENYLSMNPDKPAEGPREGLRAPEEVGFHITCYVLNLARFTRQAIDTPQGPAHAGSRPTPTEGPAHAGS